MSGEENQEDETREEEPSERRGGGNEQATNEQKKRLEEKELRLDEKEEQLNERKTELDERREELRERENNIKQRERELEDESKKLEERRENLNEREARLDEREERLKEQMEQFEEDREKEQERLERVASEAGGGATIERSMRTQTAGGVLLMVIGVLAAMTGLGLLAAVGTGTTPITLNFDVAAIAGLGLLGSGLVGELASSGLSVSLETTGLLLVGTVMIMLAILEIIGGWQAFQAKHWYFTLIAGVIGLILFFPLGLLTLFLIAVGESQFE